MNCQDYLHRFSEFVDGRLGPDIQDEMRAHHASCPSCERYFRTVTEGSDLLRGLPHLDVPDDFMPRLEHRIFHVDDGEAIARQTLGTGATTLSILVLAALMALSAWAPTLSSSEVVVDLPPVVVANPPAPSFTNRPSRPSFSRNRSLFTTAEFQDGIWGDSHTLLHEYSHLSDGRGEPLLRMGIE